jgi:hypothetical protein
MSTLFQSFSKYQQYHTKSTTQNLSFKIQNIISSKDDYLRMTTTFQGILIISSPSSWNSFCMLFHWSSKFFTTSNNLSTSAAVGSSSSSWVYKFQDLSSFFNFHWVLSFVYFFYRFLPPLDFTVSEDLGLLHNFY